MALGIAELVGRIFKPAADLVDNLHTSTEEKMELRDKMRRAEMDFALQFVEYEKQRLQSQTAIIVAEAQGGSWLQRSWRHHHAHLPVPGRMRQLWMATVPPGGGCVDPAPARAGWVRGRTLRREDLQALQGRS